MTSRFFLALSVSTFLLLATAFHEATARAENWPHWRGARMDGVSQEKGIPVKWSKSENIAWRLPLPGPAGSTPVVWDDRIFLTSIDRTGRLLLMCVSISGKELWQQVVAQGNRDVKGDEGNSASASPMTDGKHVWTLMANGILACYTTDGKPVWKVDLQERFGPLDIQFGYTCTPVLDQGRLYLQWIHGNMKTPTEQAWLTCIDATNGREIWKCPRLTKATQENKHSYSSPTIYRDKQREYLVVHGGDYVSANQLANGDEIWRYCLNPKGGTYHPTLRFVASPLAVPGMIVAPSAKNGPVVCVRPDAQGDISESTGAIHWRLDKGTPDVPSPLYYDGLVYLCREQGNLACVDATTGEILYEERTTVDRHRASPVLADGNIYLTARKGVITVVRAGRKFEILAQNDLEEPISSSPVVANGRLYLRTFDSLFAVGGPALQTSGAASAGGKTSGD